MRQITPAQAKAIAGLIDDFAESGIPGLTFNVAFRESIITDFLNFEIMLNGTLKGRFIIGSFGGVYTDLSFRTQ